MGVFYEINGPGWILEQLNSLTMDIEIFTLWLQKKELIVAIFMRRIEVDVVVERIVRRDLFPQKEWTLTVSKDWQLDENEAQTTKLPPGVRL